MVRKRIPLVTRPDQAYAFSLPQQNTTNPQWAGASDQPPRVAQAREPAQLNASTASEGHAAQDDDKASIQIDVRVNALKRQEQELVSCGIAPRQVIRAALRKAVKRWAISASYTHPSNDRRAGQASWTVRTSVAVPAAIFDRLLADQDPLGVDSRWSLVRGQLEPLVWAEIDALLASLSDDSDGVC
ncbi:hypothetical protein [Pseudogemmobacter bohemicus]|uniref:hypothetical protein n=1 Tax=Pseudogemmobacter bohemicus TaxID=2250708 RepID=UPI000DD3BC62|nr:hypothetical protein [Pseudogemmobacter bohemicus]